MAPNDICGGSGFSNADPDGGGPADSFVACAAQCLAEGYCATFAYAQGYCYLFASDKAAGFFHDPLGNLDFYERDCYIYPPEGCPVDTTSPTTPPDNPPVPPPAATITASPAMVACDGVAALNPNPPSDLIRNQAGQRYNDGVDLGARNAFSTSDCATQCLENTQCLSFAYEGSLGLGCHLNGYSEAALGFHTTDSVANMNFGRGGFECAY